MNMYVLCMYSVCVEIIEVPSETFDSPNNQKLVRASPSLGASLHKVKELIIIRPSPFLLSCFPAFPLYKYETPVPFQGSCFFLYFPPLSLSAFV